MCVQTHKHTFATIVKNNSPKGHNHKPCQGSVCGVFFVLVFLIFLFPESNDDGQGGVACCNSWGHKESDTTKLLHFTLQSLTYALRFFNKWLDILSNPW